MAPTLLHLPYSPWSERARWALDIRGIDYLARRYQPLVGEPALRRRLGRWSGRISVPVLFVDEGPPLTDSTDIARWADSRGAGIRLFPSARDADMARWLDRFASAMSAGRALSLLRVAASTAAVRELTPRVLRRFGPLARAITRAGIRRTRQKYEASAHTDAEHAATLDAVLTELRVALGGTRAVVGQRLFGEVSYADLAAAQVVFFVEPHAGNYVRIGPGNRAAFCDPDLASRYADLIEWRDDLYARHRGPVQS